MILALSVEAKNERLLLCMLEIQAQPHFQQPLSKQAAEAPSSLTNISAAL